MADSRTPVERGIHAASPPEFFEALEIPPTPHFAALKWRKRRAPDAFLNQPCGWGLILLFCLLRMLYIRYAD